MEVFLNEQSVSEQFFTQQSFDDATYALIEVVESFSNPRLPKTSFFYSPTIYLRVCDPYGGLFTAFARCVHRRDIREQFRMTWQRNFKDWSKSQMHNQTDQYVCGTEDFAGTTIAEAVCRQQASDSALLLNFAGSDFVNSAHVLVLHNNKWETVESFDDLEGVHDYFSRRFHIELFTYDASSTSPPLDRQTILRDSRRFERTARPNVKGRRVYRQISDDTLWHVDSKHRGAGAHFEVYDSLGTHIGTANLHGVVDRSREKNRSI